MLVVFFLLYQVLIHSWKSIGWNVRSEGPGMDGAGPVEEATNNRVS